jgi:hypothetical protein
MSMNDSARRGADITVQLGKLLGAVSLIVTLAVSSWAQFFGPGFWWLLGMQGLEERLSQSIDAKFDPIAADVAFILTNMPAPKVVDWDESVGRQAGDCTVEHCEYILGGSRTPYGETCGKPKIVRVELRATDGRMFDIAFDPAWMPVELRRMPVTFSVPLLIPSFAPPGAYTWRSLQMYETCTGIGEPITRNSPWWPLRIDPS